MISMARLIYLNIHINPINDITAEMKKRYETILILSESVSNISLAQGSFVSFLRSLIS